MLVAYKTVLKTLSALRAQVGGSVRLPALGLLGCVRDAVGLRLLCIIWSTLYESRHVGAAAHQFSWNRSSLVYRVQ